MIQLDKQVERSGNVYTVTEVAGMLRISKATVFRALQVGKIKGIKIGNIWRVSEEELQRIMKEGF